jgi:hypothetical protein
MMAKVLRVGRVFVLLVGVTAPGLLAGCANTGGGCGT